MESLVAGPKKGQEVLLIHSATSWGYGFRQVIPILAEAGCHVRAVDLLGFGRSTKFADKHALSHEMHVESLKTYLNTHDLKNTLLVVFGESLPLALNLVVSNRARFKGLVVVNGILNNQSGDYPIDAESFSDDKEAEVANIAQKLTKRHLHENILAGYEAPYPSLEFQWGPKHLVLSMFSAESANDSFSFGKEQADQANTAIPTWSASSSSKESLDKTNEHLQAAASFVDIKESRTYDGSGFYIEEDRGPELAHYILDILHDD